MNERIKQLAKDCDLIIYNSDGNIARVEKFAELLIAKVLDEVAERAYYNGDRNWSEDLDRPWVELEFGIGKLARLKNENIR